MWDSFFFFLLYSSSLLSSIVEADQEGVQETYQCPEYGVHFAGNDGLIETIEGLPYGWNYWPSCAELCQETAECQYWSMVQDTQWSDAGRQHCILKRTDEGFNKPDHLPTMVFISGSRNCTSLGVPPPQDQYLPGTPGGPWTEEEIGVTRQRILEMIKPLPETIKRNFDDWSHDLHIRKLSESTLIRLGFHDCLRYEDGSGGCDGCLNWKGMGNRNHACIDLNNGTQDCWRKVEMPVRTDNNDMSRTLFWLEKIYTTTNWPFTYTGPRPRTSLMDTGKSRADLWAFASWVALERSVERANHACDHDFYGRQQIPLLEGRDKCDIKLDTVHKFRYGRVDCLPTDPQLPYKTDKPELHPLTFGTGTETVQFMKDEFDMTAAEFVALIAVHSSSHHAMLTTRYFWFAPTYLSNMYHKYLANRPIYRAIGDTKGMAEDGANGWIFGRENATYQIFTAVGNSEGKPTADMRWRVFCDTHYYNTSEGGPCTWRPAAYHDQGYPSCFDGFDKTGEKMVKNSTYCEDAWIDEAGIEHGAAEPPVTDDGDLDKDWVGQFGLSHEYGLYKKFERNSESFRPYGCPGLSEKYEDMKYGQDDYVWTEQEQCPLNDFAPEGVPLYKVVEAMADYHDFWAANFLAAYEKMIQNGYPDLQDAPVNSWFGYYTMAGQDRFTEALINFEDYVTGNSPLTFTDPDVDPYVCGTHGSQFFKCRFTFSEMAELAKEQYAWPLQFDP